MIRAFFHRGVFSLWLGQVLSGVGDEVYRVAFTWICVQEVGNSVGGLSSLLCLSGMLGLVLNGRWLGRYACGQGLIRLDLLRAGITLLPVFAYGFPLLRFPALVASAILLAFFGASFEPALMEFIPRVAPSAELRRGANGLMATTYRLARVMGPSLVGALTSWIPLVHFFTFNAFSFLGSAWFIHRVDPPAEGFVAGSDPSVHLRSSWVLVQGKSDVYRSLMAKCVAGGAWALAYGVGLALLSERARPGSVESFGSLIAVYGIGNLLGAIWMGSLQRNRPELWVYIGLFWLGIGFLGMSFARDWTSILLWVGFTAMGGPINDLPFVDLTQIRFSPGEIAQVFRWRGVLESLSSLIFLWVSPWALNSFGVSPVLGACGVVMVFCALWGWRGARVATPTQIEMHRDFPS